MRRTDVLVDNVTQRKLDPEVLDELVGCLWPKDCQTCGWSLGSGPCAVVVDDLMALASASLHHPKCSGPRWNDSGRIDRTSGPLLSWVANGIVMSAADPANQIAHVPGIVLNPSLEMVHLRREKGQKWQLSTLNTFREMGFKQAEDGIQIGPSVPNSYFEITPTSWRIQLAGGFEIYEVSPEPEMTKLATKRKGILAIITQAADPGKLGPESLQAIMLSRQTVLGWVPLYEG